MVSSGFLRAVAHAPQGTPELVAGAGDVLVLAPHPDDETLGCGATIAALAAAGRQVRIVLVTDGGASHPASRRCPPRRMAALRTRELREALRILGAGRLPPPLHLGFADLAAPDDPAAIACALDRILPLLSPQTSAVWTPWAGDPHPDHQRTARLAQQLAARLPQARLWAYPVWGRFADTPPPDPAQVLRIAPGAWAATKRRALRAHRSQMSALIPDDPGGFVMTKAHQTHFLTEDEIFLRQPDRS